MAEPEQMPIRVEVALPPDDPGPVWAWTDVTDYVRTDEPVVVHLRQAAYNPTGGPHYPPPPRRYRAWVVQPDGTRRLLGAQRLPWWRRIWRRRRG